eukprot:m.50854 g.50854  ORF g.50854 m.50854 type:complete len:691 (-) comp21358_c0_seq1:61-2133(-)
MAMSRVLAGRYMYQYRTSSSLRKCLSSLSMVCNHRQFRPALREHRSRPKVQGSICNTALLKYYSRSAKDPPVTTSKASVPNTIADNDNNITVADEQSTINELETTASKKLVPRKDELRKIVGLAHGEGKYIGSAVALLLISSSVSMSVPMGMGYIIDIIVSAGQETPENLHETLVRTCVGLGGVFVVGAAANAGRVFLIQRSGQRIVARLRTKMFSHLASLDMAFFDQMKTGELVNRLSSDTVEVGKALAGNISDGLRSMAQGLVGVSLMVYLSPSLAAVFLVVVPPVAIVAALYGRTIKKLSQQTQTALGAASARADEVFANIFSVRACAQEKEMGAQYDNHVQEAYRLSVREVVARAGFFGFAGLAGNLGLISVLGYGGSLAASQAMTVGNLSAFLLYTGYVGASVVGVTSFHAELMKGIGASTRLFDLLDIKPTPGGTIQIPSHEFHGAVKFENVSFRYPSRPGTVLSNLNLAAEPGSSQAIVGTSGSGKSTLFSLLLGLYEPTSGRVLIDGYNVRDLDFQWLRRQIGVVEQTPVLFSGTIADNICFGVDGATLADIKDAAAQAYALDFINDFPQGFDTIVGERGVMLSGGQQQRVAIARAILKNPRILLLDEATSALDAESESYVQNALKHLMVGRTTLQIAHRLSTISDSSQIAVLQHGAVAELGTYDELTQKKKVFFELMQRQI